MLTELRVKNFALIKDLSVHFDKGLNVITGETGAGKSLLLRSLQILMGAKAHQNLTGKFSEDAVVEGLFIVHSRRDIQKRLKDLSYNLDEGSTLLVRRILSSKGRSKTYINGSLASLNELKSIVSPLIDLSGSSEPLIELTNQHDNKNLQEISYQRDLFDSYCKHKELRYEIAKLYALLKEHQNNLRHLEAGESDRLQKLDFLNFQLKELEDFKPETEDYNMLQDLKSKKFKEEQYRQVIHMSKAGLKDSTNSVISQLYTLINEFEKLQPDHPILQALNTAVDSSEEAMDQVNKLESSMAYDEDLTFEEIDDRIRTYNHLFRKYSTDAEGLSGIFQDLTAQRTDLEQAEENRDRLKSEISLVFENLNPLLEELSKSRKSFAKIFEQEVSKHLKELNMKELKLKVKFKETDVTEYGKESIEFWLSHGRKNLQERPIKQAASGGELSRILLALKSSLENQEAPRTYLFDEIDSGVSGLTAGMVGQKLKRLSTGQQVITITHLPQVAALGDHHFLIEKSSGLEGQETNLNTLKKNDRIQELARLLSGKSITKTSINHAKELLDEKLSATL